MQGMVKRKRVSALVISGQESQQKYRVGVVKVFAGDEARVILHGLGCWNCGLNCAWFVRNS
jgi:hypothetical protein